MNSKMKKVIGYFFAVAVFVVPAVSLAATAPFINTNNASLIKLNSATLNGHVTPNATSTTAWFEWGTTQTFANTTPHVNYGTTERDFSKSISGLSANTTYYYRAGAQNIYGLVYGSTLSFTTIVHASSEPTVTTNSATSILENSAILNGYITPNGTHTTAWFEWGEGYLLGNKTPSINYDSADRSFSNSLLGLSTGTTYYYRAVTPGSFGLVYGTTRTFTTKGLSSSKPSVTTSGASFASQSSATLGGYVTPNGVSTTAWFEWGASKSFGNTTPHVNYGINATSFYNSIYNLNVNTTYYYRAVAQSSYGTVYGSTLTFTQTAQSYNNSYSTSSQPYVTTNSAGSVSHDSAKLNGYVDAMGSNTSAWFEWGTTSALGNTTPSVNYGNVNYGTGATNYDSTILNLALGTTYYYRAVAQNPYGTVHGSILSFTTTSQNYVSDTYDSLPTATTLLATELTGTTSKLNGLVFASGNQTSSAWFEWGTSSSLGNSTEPINVGALPVVKQSDFLTGLTQGRTYYYRIVAENSYGKVYGAVNTFVSQAGSYVATQTQTTPVVAKSTKPVTPIFSNPTTIVLTEGSGEQSIASLYIDGGPQNILSKEKRIYRITWKNDSTENLRNVVLRITFPRTINVDSGTRGTFSSEDNAVLVDLKTLSPGEVGESFVTATTRHGLNNGELLVVTANMVYTDINGVQGDTIAYVMHHAGEGQQKVVPSASTTVAGEFIPTTLFEWVLLMILTLILVLLGNHLYGRFSSEKH